MPNPAADPAPSPANVHYELRYPELTRWRRMQIPVLGWLGILLVRAIGPTLRFEVLGYQHYQRARAAGRPVVAAFWHRSIFPAVWWWRNREVVVMNTTNFDGQWTRRVIENLGFWTAQGSSSRGGLRGLAVMAERLEQGHDVAFTIDGPRGPRYVAKPGPAILARKTGNPIMVFHIGVERGHTFERSWDLFRIPWPFSRAVMIIAPTIEVPGEADRDALERKHAEMQTALDRVRVLAENWFRLGEAERDRVRRSWQEGSKRQ
ncbi:MAG TPA: lysophospholipid acyltransferase family protein [Candidatus Acidoferrales bacterium]|nr:lysophospholipid acyltransferase family protein [Candidatus Acidoferrales bacterium]